MTLTLWRGDHVLGPIHLDEPPTPEKLVGILLPLVGVSELKSMTQTRVQGFPGRPVLQFPREADVELERPALPSNRSSRGVRGRRFSEEEAETAAIAPELQLTVRDDRDQIVPFRIIMVEELPLPADMLGKELKGVPENAVLEGSLWAVFAFGEF